MRCSWVIRPSKLQCRSWIRPFQIVFMLYDIGRTYSEGLLELNLSLTLKWVDEGMKMNYQDTLVKILSGENWKVSWVSWSPCRILCCGFIGMQTGALTLPSPFYRPRKAEPQWIFLSMMCLPLITLVWPREGMMIWASLLCCNTLRCTEYHLFDSLFQIRIQ